MADPNILTTLRRKRDEIEAVIAAYEKKIEAARYDLAHVNATLRLFELNGAPETFPAHIDVTRLFRREELFKLCQDALRAAPEGLDTRELGLAVMRAKGLDEADAVLRKSVNYRIVQTMRANALRGAVCDAGRRGYVRVWGLRLE